jgi:hypothetical protein
MHRSDRGIEWPPLRLDNKKLLGILLDGQPSKLIA